MIIVLMPQVAALQKVLPLIPRFHAHAVAAIYLLWIKIGGIQGIAKVSWQHDIRINMTSPTVRRKQPLRPLYHPPLAELPVAVRFIRKKQFQSPLAAHFLCLTILRRRGNDPTIKHAAIVTSGDIEKIVIGNTNGDCLDPHWSSFPRVIPLLGVLFLHNFDGVFNALIAFLQTRTAPA
jgi:hypothetical protein